MEKIESRARRMGFTMLEIIVVMGIIGILLTIMMPLLSGTRNSALTAQCKNNMKSLALGTIAYAQANSDGPGHFPSAGFYRSLDSNGVTTPARRRSKKGGVSYYPRRAWISNYGNIEDLNNSRSSLILGDVVYFTSPDEQIRVALTNGAIWRASGESYETYRCPVHAKSFEKANGRLPGWSYMMNQEFGYNRESKGLWNFFGSNVGGNITVSTDSSAAVDKDKKRKKAASRSPDKVLMFAEVQGVDVTDSKNGVSLKGVLGGNDYKSDCVLEYTKESMGFNHPMGKGKYGGNVAFADGHVDTVILPREMDIKDLTRYLCQGYDAPHDGRKYQPNATDE